MTRWARGGNAGKKKPHDASSWEDIRQEMSKQSLRGTSHQKAGAMKEKGKQKKRRVEGRTEEARKKKPEAACSKSKQTNQSVSRAPIRNQSASTSKTVDSTEKTSHYDPLPSDKSLVDVLLAADSASDKKVAGVARGVARETEASLGSHTSEHALWKRQKRSEERRLKRQQKKADNMVCFHCRQPGHGVADCPEILGDVEQGTGICFRCGSTEHDVTKCTAKVDKRQGEFPYAKCFICHQTGHLSRTCPDNPRGLYPEGGGCKECGSVEHRWWNCPAKKPVKGVDVEATTASSVDKGFHMSADAEPAFLKRSKVKVKKTGPKVVVFKQS